MGEEGVDELGTVLSPDVEIGEFLVIGGDVGGLPVLRVLRSVTVVRPRLGESEGGDFLSREGEGKVGEAFAIFLALDGEVDEMVGLG